MHFLTNTTFIKIFLCCEQFVGFSRQLRMPFIEPTLHSDTTLHVKCSPTFQYS